MTPLVPHHPFRFGLNCWETESAAAWRDFAKEAEDLGYSTVVIPDHVVVQQLAPIAAMATAAAATEILRVGSYVLCNDFRHPAVLAKELACVDLLSDGRLEIGIGAGWAEADYQFLHQPFDTGAARIDRLEQSVAVLKACFADEPVDHPLVGWSGLHALPKPLQQPHPPLLIGGGGPRMLRLAAREADIVGLNTLKRRGNRMEGGTPAQSLPEEAAAKQLDLIREAAGTRLPALEINANVMAAIVTNDGTGAAMGIAPAISDLLLQTASETRALVGTVEQIVETCLRRRELLGINYITLPHTAMRAFAPIVAVLGGK